MIAGIGTDIVEVARILKSIESERFMQKVFSRNEIFYCEPKANKAECFAARFAAKEAFSKALGTGFRGDISFTEIEIINDELGKPSIKTSGKTFELLTKRNIRIIHVSLSHVKEMAIAMVILEY
jgi:holo-[acyl-carrier protein] synthase